MATSVDRSGDHAYTVPSVYREFNGSGAKVVAPSTAEGRPVDWDPHRKLTVIIDPGMAGGGQVLDLARVSDELSQRAVEKASVGKQLLEKPFEFAARSIASLTELMDAPEAPEEPALVPVHPPQPPVAPRVPSSPAPRAAPAAVTAAAPTLQVFFAKPDGDVIEAWYHDVIHSDLFLTLVYDHSGPGGVVYRPGPEQLLDIRLREAGGQHERRFGCYATPLRLRHQHFEYLVFVVQEERSPRGV